MPQHDVIGLIAEHLGIERDKIQMDSHFEKDLGADSLDTADLLLAVREEFGVNIRKDEVMGILTVEDLVNKVNKRPG